MVAFDRLADPTNATCLVVALRNLGVNLRRGERLPCAASLDQQLQLCLLVEALDRTRRIIGIVPDPVLISVGVKMTGR
jgi:hypothetical protein